MSKRDSAQAELFVTTGRLSISPAKIKDELWSARRLLRGASVRLGKAENLLTSAKKSGSRADVIRCECDVMNVHSTIRGLEKEIGELERELMGEWAPASWAEDPETAAGPATERA